MLLGRFARLHRLAPRAAGVRLASAAAHRASATAVIQGKIKELSEALAREDAYLGPITAAQRTSDVHFGDERHRDPTLARLRVVPDVVSFYMANPQLEETMRTLRAFVRAFQTLPRIPAAEYKRPAWLDPNALYAETKSGLSKQEIDDYYALLDQLNMIDPHLQPPPLRALLHRMLDTNRGSADVADSRPRVVASLLAKKLDEHGRSATVGRRKTASARALIARAPDPAAVPGQILINGVSLEQFFTAVIQREEVLHPLRVANMLTKLNVSVSVLGGGYASQATAAGLAIAKGICVQNPLLIDRLLAAGCLLTDARKKERKKPGKAKARKSYGWVKR